MKMKPSAVFLFVRSGLHVRSLDYDGGLGGMCLRRQASLPEIGERAMVVLEAPGRTVTAWAEVCWLGAEACGMRFLDLSRNDLSALLELGFGEGGRSIFPWER